MITDISDQSTYRHGPLGSINGFIFHHTGGRGTPQGVVNTLNQRGLGTQYVMDRDGSIYRTLPAGARGAQIVNSSNTNLSNDNTEGMEIIANNDKDLTPAQIASAKQFGVSYAQQHPGVQFYGHGMINPGHKEPTEGYTITNEVRSALSQPTIAPGGVTPGAYTPGAGGTPTLQPGATPFVMPANAPMGMQNNNPLNIKYSVNGVPIARPFAGIVGPSKNTDQGDPQIVFESPQAGWRAGYQLLSQKYDSGMLTPNQIIAGHGGWTPGNMQAAANIAKTMGIGPDEDIKLSDPTRATAFMRALVTQEQGATSKAYSDAMIQEAVTGKFPIGGAAAPASTATPAGTGATTTTPTTTAPDYIPLSPEQRFDMSIGQALASLGTGGTLGGGGSVSAGTTEPEPPDEPAIRAPALTEQMTGPSPIPAAFAGGAGSSGSIGSQLGSLAMQPGADPTGAMLAQNAPSITQGAPSMTAMLPTLGTSDAFNYLDPRRTVSPALTMRQPRLA